MKQGIGHAEMEIKPILAIIERIARSEQALAELQAQLAASQARVGELEKALQEALMIIEVGLDTGTFELAGSLADIPARCRAALAAH